MLQFWVKPLLLAKSWANLFINKLLISFNSLRVILMCVSLYIFVTAGGDYKLLIYQFSF